MERRVLSWGVTKEEAEDTATSAGARAEEAEEVGASEAGTPRAVGAPGEAGRLHLVSFVIL